MNQPTPLALIQNARRHDQRIAVVDEQCEHTYNDLLKASSRVAAALLDGSRDLREESVAFAVTPGFQWVATLWGIWRAGGIAVPLPSNAARPELEYILDDTRASIAVFDEVARMQLATLAGAHGMRTMTSDQRSSALAAELPMFALDRQAMILYTSGTTSRPKGVVTTHANIEALIRSLLEAWEWSESDVTALCLPLHHVHGIINVVSCALWSGACVHMLPRFDTHAIWELIGRDALTVFMAVPTIYVKLISAWEEASPERRQDLSRSCARLRLMVSGSAALPVSTLRQWEAIGGHTLLERYGMTEIGMALSNPLHGKRVPGSVGTPLPDVEIRLVGESGELVAEGTAGEIQVRGPGVFAEYWGKPEATGAAFRDGWFMTGDTAIYEGGVYRILGRTSIDILKTGGHKVSALEIEEALRMHPDIAECAVVGVPDPVWGESVAAALVLKEGRSLDLTSLHSWGREFLASYKLPRKLLLVDALPRNAMGKIVKPTVVALFQSRTSVETLG
jgi:malonyl-CoA/methylmalonyl-CoA synthetase